MRMPESDAFFQSLRGAEVAGYRLTELLGTGGMAGVFRGENTLNPGIVRAIKVVRPELATRREFALRFSQEAVILENLRHPNVVRFYGLRTDKREGIDLLVMELELLEGETLAAAMVRKPSVPPLRAAVGWMHAAAEGLAAAHALGVVHRDVKPENLFLTTRGEIKVLDFGIARAHDEADRREQLTAVGTAPGSPAYMAPEVCEGQVPGTSADVYALGISLYELLIRRHPFAAPGEELRLSSTQLMFAHVNRALPKLRELRPDAPDALEQVVSRATAKEASWRYPSAAELATALGAVLDALGPAEAAGEAPIGTQFEIPTLFDSKRSGTGPRASFPDGRPSSPGAAGSQRTPLASTLKESPPDGSSRFGKVALVAGLVLVGIAPAAYFGHAIVSRHGEAPEPSAASSGGPGALGSVSAAPASSVAAPPPKNRWVSVHPPPKPVLLGVSSDRAPSDVSGFRPSRQIVAPAAPYEIQQHEVTWEELDPWLAESPSHEIVRPAWLPGDAKGRARLPATGVPWETARTYCRSLDGTLPTEEQWEYAARGAERRPYAWGTQRGDLSRTRAYARAQKDALPVAPVGSMDQDQTPEIDGEAILDMTGNAMEWTVDLYRDDRPKQDESWTEAGGKTFRAVRGLPLDKPPPPKLPAEGLAVRDSLCATGPCPKSTAALLQYVGFRCVRKARRP
jgi:eukaryotic-like serine/threonine-protein kinase